jgi:ABC-2 type transport system permease protein
MTPTTQALPAFNSSRPIKLTAFRVLHSELIKLRSLHSTIWSAVVVILGTSALAAVYALAVQPAAYAEIPARPLNMTLQVAQYVIQFVALIMGTLGAASEYSSGAIRSSLCAVPRRWNLLACQVVAITLMLAATMALALGLAYPLVYGILEVRGFGPDVALVDLRQLLGMVFYGVVIGLIGFFFSFATRSTVGGISFGLGLTFILPIMLTLSGSVGLAWGIPASGLLPEHLASQTWAFASLPDYGGVAGGFGFALAWIVLGFIVTGILFQKRDA